MAKKIPAEAGISFETFTRTTYFAALSGNV